MDKQTMSATLAAISNAGIQLSIQAPVVGGITTVVVTPSQALRYLTDPHAVTAECLGFTSEEYSEYMASDGTIYCQATTKVGRRCKRSFDGMTKLTPAAWKKSKDAHGYCSIHGENGNASGLE